MKLNSARYDWPSTIVVALKKINVRELLLRRSMGLMSYLNSRCTMKVLLQPVS